MATTTFEKRIVIDDKAADVLIELLNKPAPPRPKASGIHWITEEDDKCFLQNRSLRLSAQKQKKQPQGS